MCWDLGRAVGSMCSCCHRKGKVHTGDRDLQYVIAMMYDGGTGNDMAYSMKDNLYIVSPGFHSILLLSDYFRASISILVRFE